MSWFQPRRGAIEKQLKKDDCRDAAIAGLSGGEPA